jgi:predicted nucleic acid-binding protein
MSLVLDNSITMAWLMPDENSTPANALLHRVAVGGAVVPPLWHLEVGNSLTFAIRQRRISVTDRADAIGFLRGLPIEVDDEMQMRSWSDTLDLADRFKLTLYDACYLELAQRKHLPLATLDGDLRKAGGALGLELLGA